ncbi:hypothetical protein B7494_g6331 [Chlorociboria aeruginascens]|nr:hypothetical protein B7494_g6331 [Chlorociboria aeruginascens]
MWPEIRKFHFHPSPAPVDSRYFRQLWNASTCNFCAILWYGHAKYFTDILSKKGLLATGIYCRCISGYRNENNYVSGDYPSRSTSGPTGGPPLSGLSAKPPPVFRSSISRISNLLSSDSLESEAERLHILYLQRGKYYCPEALRVSLDSFRQIMLLKQAEEYVEVACFDMATRSRPQALKRVDGCLEYATDVGLNEWCKLPRHPDDKHLGKVLSRIGIVRNVVAHQLRHVPVESLKLMLQDCKRMLVAYGSHDCAAKVQQMIYELKRAFDHHCRTYEERKRHYLVEINDLKHGVASFNQELGDGFAAIGEDRRVPELGLQEVRKQISSIHQKPPKLADESYRVKEQLRLYADELKNLENEYAKLDPKKLEDFDMTLWTHLHKSQSGKFKLWENNVLRNQLEPIGGYETKVVEGMTENSVHGLMEEESNRGEYDGFGIWWSLHSPGSSCQDFVK